MKHSKLTKDSLLTPNQVADICCVHPATLRRWARTGRFPPPLCLSPSTLRWYRESVVAWLEERASNR